MVKLFPGIDPSAKVLPPPHRVFDDEPSDEDKPVENKDKVGERIRSIKMKSVRSSQRKQKAKVEAATSITKRKISKPKQIVADGGSRVKADGENLSNGNLMLRKSAVSPQRTQTGENGASTDHPDLNCDTTDEREDVILNNKCRRPRNPRMCIGIKIRSATNSV